MHDIGRGLCWALDAVPFAEDRLGFAPDAWQAQLLRSRSQWILLNCCRQSGKSTTTAARSRETRRTDWPAADRVNARGMV